MTCRLILGTALLVLTGCSQESRDAKNQAPASGKPLVDGGTIPTVKLGNQPLTGRPGPSDTTASVAKVKFRVQEVPDKTQGGLTAFRFVVPEDWKAGGRVEWHYNDLYMPVKAFGRAESPDGSAWVEMFPAELFWWLDPRFDKMPTGGGSIGGIHQANITIQDAMIRTIIGRYRNNVQNLKVVGVRPVKNLAQAFHQPEMAGDGICVRVSYQLDGQPVDEEFYGQLTKTLTIPYTGPQGTTYEYHRLLALVHSLGAKSAKLEPNRDVMGFVATSAQADKNWQEAANAVVRQLADNFNKMLAAGYERIRAAGELSRTISANNDAMIRAMDQQRAAANARTASAPASDPYRTAEQFDQYIREVETVQDSNGVQYEASSMYNYHWIDGSGNMIHSNDPSYDPNQHSPVPYDPLKRVQ